MVEIMRLFAPTPNLRSSSRALHALFLLAFLFCLALSGHVNARAAALQGGPVTSPGPRSQFAIADFDGDVRPDLATVQAAPGNSGATTTYWIQLQLSTVGLQSIRLVAPSGGLRIKARDVNGDRAVDLVIATAWFNQPVAILLNDGHGGFSRAEPSVFPRAFSRPGACWDSGSISAADPAGVLPQSDSGICAEEGAALHSCPPAALITPSSSAFPVNSFLISHAGRAPPPAVLSF